MNTIQHVRKRFTV